MNQLLYRVGKCWLAVLWALIGREFGSPLRITPCGRCFWIEALVFWSFPFQFFCLFVVGRDKIITTTGPFAVSTMLSSTKPARV
jgi:hypothetical protein